MTVRELIEQLIAVDDIDEEIYIATAEDDSGKEISHIEQGTFATFIIHEKEKEVIDYKRTDYLLRLAVQNSTECKNCEFNHGNGICFFAYDCIFEHNSHYMKGKE